MLEGPTLDDNSKTFCFCLCFWTLNQIREINQAVLFIQTDYGLGR